MRESGILLPIFSLPSPHGIGCFSKEAYEFVDFLERTGQKYWQILPLGPTSYGDSPYQSFSTYAGNPYFIDLDELVKNKLITRKECAACDCGSDPEKIDYEKLYNNRMKLLRKAYERANVGEDPEFREFQEKNGWWLRDYSIFMAVKDVFGGASWQEWAEDIKFRWPNAMEYYQVTYYFEIEFYQYLQYLFAKQWFALKEYANQKGIRIIGDIPIYVAYDSADVWAHPELFQFDEERKPTAVAGCPPDGFSADGQLWGNPLYRWELHEQTHYDWWTGRIAYCYELYDVVRIDHFRGFDEYYSIPYGDDTAKNGHWEKGPGMSLFRTISQRLGEKQIIAEDLGYMTDSVKKLVKDSGYPGMKVLEFAFDSRDSSNSSDYLPHNFDPHCVAYTGTHDNETLRGWLDSITPEEMKAVREYLYSPKDTKEELVEKMVRLMMSSVAQICIIPVQDYLCLGNEARINHPSTLGKNWMWRMKKGAVSKRKEKEIAELTRIYGRFHQKN